MWSQPTNPFGGFEAAIPSVAGQIGAGQSLATRTGGGTDVNSIDIELDTEDVDQFVNAVRLMGPSFGGINLEDIKTPECFMMESRLKEIMDIPVFHGDQHGTAVIWQGRTERMNQWKSAHAVKTDLRTLEEALVGTDVVLGVSVKGAVTPDMV